MDIIKLLDTNVTLQGLAKEAKGGPVIITEENHVIYIRKLIEWPPDLEDKKVSVTGLLKQIKFIPDPVVDEDGAISCGAYGDQYVIENAKFKLAD